MLALFFISGFACDRQRETNNYDVHCYFTKFRLVSVYVN